MKVQLLLTFDHELPLGRLDTSYADALFEPTEQLMQLAERHGVRVTLFTDILCAYRYREWDPDGFYAPYCRQLIRALDAGHDVQLHIHPHWLTSTHDGQTFVPSADFALADFENDARFGGIDGIVRLAIDTLTAICRPSHPHYRCVAFRAGGYNIRPATAAIFDSLYRHGIRFDSSMAKGYSFASALSDVDFRRLPRPCNWTIDPADYRRALPHDGGIVEVPIATLPKSPFELPTRLKLKTAGTPPDTARRGQMIHTDRRAPLAARLRTLFAARMLTFDNHTYSVDYLLKILRRTIRRYDGTADTISCCAIGHPKSMGGRSLQLMDGFIGAVTDYFPAVRFVTYRQLER